MEWMEPKTDWTEDDFYNYWDLDRVENNTKVIADMLGIDVEDTTVDRDYKSLIWAETLNRIERNIEKLCFWELADFDRMKTDWQDGSVLDSDPFGWQDAIRLERNLKTIYDTFMANKVNTVYCGEMICGEMVI